MGPWSTELDNLRPFGLVWNQHCSILVCKVCHVGVAPREVKAHCHTHHINKSNVGPEYDTIISGLKTLQPDKDTVPQTPPDLTTNSECEAVEGLYVFEGYRCNVCKYCSRGGSTMRNHFLIKHAGRCTGKNCGSLAHKGLSDFVCLAGDQGCTGKPIQLGSGVKPCMDTSGPSILL